MKKTTRLSCITEIGLPPVKLAQATAFGDLLFINGLGSFQSGRPALQPLTGSEHAAQIRTLFKEIGRLLNDQDRYKYQILATEQRFMTPQAVPVFHRHRRAAWDPIPPSTSVLQSDPSASRQTVQLDAIAADRNIVRYVRIEHVDLPSTSGFVPVAAAGSLYCVAGFMAAHGEGDLGGMAPEVLIPPGHQWKGDRTRREINYIWEKKLLPIMASLQLQPHHICKVALFYTQIDELGDIVESWNDLFDGLPPLTNYISVREAGLAITEARVEINLYLDSERLVNPGDDRFTTMRDGYSRYSRFGDYLVFLIYPDPGVACDENDPWVSRAEFETNSVAAKLQEAFYTLGCGFESVARISQYMLQCSDLMRSCRIWEKHFGEAAIPLSLWNANRLPLNNIQLYIEAWVYSTQP